MINFNEKIPFFEIYYFYKINVFLIVKRFFINIIYSIRDS